MSSIGKVGEGGRDFGNVSITQIGSCALSLQNIIFFKFLSGIGFNGTKLVETSKLGGGIAPDPSVSGPAEVVSCLVHCSSVITHGIKGLESFSAIKYSIEKTIDNESPIRDKILIKN